MEDFIQLKKDDLLRINFKDQYGNDKEGQLIFDLEDIELPIKYQEMFEEHKKNVNYVQHQMLIIDKKQDSKGKKIFSKNEEEKFKVIIEFYQREMKALDLFLGEGKTQMILDLMERKPYLTMFDDINEMLEQIMPKLKETFTSIDDKIKNKYKMAEENVLKDE